MNNVAVCLSGHSRTFDRTIKKIKDAFGDADFFFSTWYDDKNEELIKIFRENEINLVAFEFVSEPSQVLREREIISNFQNSFPDFFILNQWYGVKRALRLALDHQEISGKKYDCIIRCRFDLDIEFSLPDLVEKSINGGVNIVPAATGGSDQFIFGGHDVMTKFLSFEDWLINYAKRFKGEYGFFASLLVRAYFLDIEIPVNMIDLPLKVLRAGSGSAKVLREQRTREYIAINFPEYASIAWVGERILPKSKNPKPWDVEFHAGKNLFFKNGKPA